MLNSTAKLFLFFSLFLASCTTTLKSKKFTLASPANETGATYYLPQQTIRAAITYQLRSCGDVADIRKTASISTTNSIDGNAKFFVPAKNLSSGNKTTSLTVATLDDGTLRSLGATVDDRTGEIVGGLVSSAGSIARLATGTAFSDPEKCSTEFGGMDGIVKQRDNLEMDLRNSNAFKGEGERTGAIEAYNRLVAATTITRNISFTPNPTAPTPIDRVLFAANSSSSTKMALERWLDKNGGQADDYITDLLETTICIRPGIDGGSKLANGTKNDNECGADELLSQPDRSITSQNKLPKNGLIFREPKHVLVVVCNNTCGDVKEPQIIGRQQVALAQFGPWRSIELTSKPFQDKNVMASWTNAGRLTSLTIGSSSSLEALANSLNASATSIREAAGAIVTTDQEALNAEIAITRAQADLIEQQNRLEGLQNTITDLSDNGNLPVSNTTSSNQDESAASDDGNPGNPVN